MVATKNKAQARKRMSKAERKNLRLWAEGKREEVLQEHLEAITIARLSGTWAEERERLQAAFNHYHAAIPWQTEDHEEPELRPYDPKAPIVVEKLSPELEQKKRERIEVLNLRINRWYVYRIRHALKQRREATLDPRRSAYAILLGRLAGLKKPPKARQGFQQLMHESYSKLIAPAVEQKRAAIASGTAETTATGLRVGFRAEVAREVYNALPKDQQDVLKDRAHEQAQVAKDKYMEELKNGPPRDAESRHRAVMQLPGFIMPLLKGIYDTTGLLATLVVAGPMPEFNGEVRAEHVSYTGEGKPQWAHWDRDRFQKQVLDFMAQFAETQFTAEDRNAAILADDSKEQREAMLTKALYVMPVKTVGNREDVDSDSVGGSDEEECWSSDTNSSEDEEATQLVEAMKRKKVKAKEKEKRSKNTGKSSKTAGSRATKSAAKPKEPRNKDAANVEPATSSALAPDRPTTMTVHMSGLGDVTFSDPYAHIPTEQLSPEKQREQNIRRNRAMVAMMDLRGAASTANALEAGKRRADEMDGTEGTSAKRARMEASGDTEDGEVDVEMLSVGPELQGVAADPMVNIALATDPKVDTAPAADPQADAACDTDLDPDAAPAADAVTAATPAADPIGEAAPIPNPDTARTTDPDPDDAPAADTVTTAPPKPDTAPAADPNGDATPIPDSDTAREPGGALVMVTMPEVTPTADPASAIAAVTPSGESAPKSARSTPACPPKAAQWFAAGHENLTAVDLGPHYDAVIAAWIRIERASRWESSSTNLPNARRPKEISTWIAGRRRKVPVITDVSRYVECWNAWWDSLQPQWRKRSGDAKRWERTTGYGPTGRGWTPSGEYGGDQAVWGNLFQWGPNGVMTAVASIYFWGMQVQKSGAGEGMEAWEEATVDVGWVLEGLAGYYELWTKKGRRS
ncbi:unnamed protein product [Mycena citricolor]|uniref:Uncharacterized protein n=1 Tax=Mycena citricolor TaxID=2018698 RepID=A0AAD2JXX6_9AGAR|nr:unnamed protein product [Mycena citricolor]